ncbi:B-cell receptor CD22-like isoform X3 [Sander lucioperca]|uniref:B-cell receptor CD22-like isoform X3 n=1 Tax=Sander lucioperca TaxID=283035 RepID=UPI001653BEE8|nr:B-cell receptor CD22-like isoform X3 [Sander lucioperca]XP_035855914.1 B-cell receptor CD22-like isoform X3 [Sander lucioperca]
MSLTAAASGFVVFLLSVQVIQGQDDWGVTYTSTQICAVKGSTVNIRCSYTYPYRWKGSVTTVEKTLWFTKMNYYQPVDLTTDSEYSGRVQYSYKNKDCTLRISDLRERDSAVYKFMFTTNQEGGRYISSPGVTLSVTAGLQVISHSNWLECQSSCRLPNNPSYVWYKNGQEIQTQTSYYLNPVYYSDSYSCALQGYKDFPSPSVCVQGESCNRVTYTDRSICASEGSSVDISCTYSSYEDQVESKLWFRRERNHRGQNPSQPEDLSTDSQYTGRVHVETERGRSTLRISDLRERDSAEYHFKFITPSFEWRSSLPGTTLTVTALQVQVIRVYQSQTKAELKCHSSCSPAGRLSYVWFKNREHITWVETSTYTTWFNPTDVFSCALKGHEKFPSPSVYGPKLPSVSVSPSGEIVEGSSVTLTCSSDANPAANYTWYKENEDSPKASGQIFTITDFRAEHSGNYYCEAQNRRGRQNSTLHLIVVADTSTITLITNSIRLTLVGVGGLIPLLLFCRWMRKKKALSSTTEPDEPKETVELDSCPEYEDISETAAQTEDPEEQEDLV